MTLIMKPEPILCLARKFPIGFSSDEISVPAGYYSVNDTHPAPEMEPDVN